MDNTKISVVIPSYHPGPEIADCVGSVLESGRNRDLEVWIVDSSEGDISHLIKDFLRDERVRLIRGPHRLYPGEARNLGARESTGDLLAFIDADCTAAIDWLDNLVGRLENDGNVVCGGAVENGTPESYIGTIEFLTEFGSITTRNPSREDVRFAPSGNMAIRRDVYMSAGGFSKEHATGEDVAFGKRLRELGVKISFTNEAVVFHKNRTRLKDFILNQYRLGRGFFLNFQRGNQPFSWIGESRLLSALFLVLIFPMRLGRTIFRVVKNGEIDIVRLFFYLPGMALGALFYTLGCVKQFFSREKEMIDLGR